MYRKGGRALIKNMKIRTKMFISVAIAIVASFMLGLCGYLNISGMNGMISDNDYLIVQPLVYLNRITFDIGQIESLVRDAIIDVSEARGDIYKSIQNYQDDIRRQFNGYLYLVSERSREGTDDYTVLSDLSIKVSEWSMEIDTVASLSANGQRDAALSRLHDTVVAKGLVIGTLLEQLVAANESQAAESRESARGGFTASSILILGLFTFIVCVMTVFGIMITGSITKSVNSIVSAAEALADGSIRTGHAALPNGFGLDYVDGDGVTVVPGVAPNALTSTEWRDPYAGTPWHKHVPARIEALLTGISSRS